MRIAIASTDGTTVNEHFGQASRFLIYDLAGGTPAFVEERSTTPYSSGDKSHPFDQSRFDGALAALAGCERVYCAKIGDKPTEELQKAGIEVVIYEGPIAEIK